MFAAFPNSCSFSLVGSLSIAQCGLMTSSYGTCEDKCAIVSHAVAGELNKPCKGSLI
jgi:hypothetical protein